MTHILLALALAFTPTARPEPPPPAKTAVIATTGPELCDGQTRTLYWIAPANLTIWRLELYPLSDGAAPGQPFPAVDYHTTVYSSRPAGRILAVQALDHYAPFTADPLQTKVFTTAEAVRLRAGDHLAVLHSCQAQFGLVSHSQALVIVTYVEGTP